MGTVNEEIEKTCSLICDEYCKFQEQCDSEEGPANVNNGKGCPLDKLHEMFS